MIPWYTFLTLDVGARKPKIDNNIDVPSLQTMEEANQLAASEEEIKPKIEYAI